MSVLAGDEVPRAFEDAVKPGFWQRLARALDASFADRSKQVMTVDALRRSRRDIERCRRLLRTGMPPGRVLCHSHDARGFALSPQ